MEQNDKNLLIKDLCGRLPYGVVVHFEGWNPEKLTQIDLRELVFNDMGGIPKPYLRPLSSMTEEERDELKRIFNCDYVEFDCLDFTVGGSVDYDTFCMYYEHCAELIDWLNENHFDYRGLIPKGLALEAKEGMYKN